MLFPSCGKRTSHRWIYFLSPFLSFFLVACYLFWPRSLVQHAAEEQDKHLNISPIPSPSSEGSGCPLIPGLEDIHIVLKTGATESPERLSVHFDTTLSCVHNFTIFSDYEEDLLGFHIHDVLKDVNNDIKNTNPDFELYNHLRKSGREGLSTWNVTNDPSTPSGKPQNPGWVLDKWKFLPMMHETLKARDDAKWYLFMEADTFIIWANLLAWLQQFNANEAYYLGSQMQIGDVIFAHGGSGFVLSHAALKKVAEYHSTRVKEWDEYTAGHWAGDCVLGKALQDAGVGLLWSWPMLQGSTPWTFDYLSPAYGGVNPWCYPPVAYHHMMPDDIRQAWEFAQSWYRESGSLPFLHRDVFQRLIQPRFTKPGEDWDNESPDVIEGIGSVLECERHCTADAGCLQYSYEPEACRVSKVVRRGGRKSGVISGWLTERIDQATAQLGSCNRIDWIHP